MSGQEGHKLERWAPAGQTTCPLAVGAERPKARGRASPQGPVLGAEALRGAPPCCSLPGDPQTPWQPSQESRRLSTV